MLVRNSYRNVLVRRAASGAAFTLVEVLVSLVILALVLAGVCYGYTQANRIAVWSSMSQAAQSYALQGMEQARAALWNAWDPNGDELPASTNAALVQPDFMDIPMRGTPTTSNYVYLQTNYVYITTVTNCTTGNFSSALRQITSIVVWRFPLTGQSFTNTVVTMRASDQ
ncbi:MAG TPA: prepilin-type N-terminal cleavage/methylation domain-containing protein [Alphaproteobacteria bacterium]|nr:prepilin-type N-terminal cleavage/methylation domain-containing protein [Alphaproteobacteria bacterium]